MAMFDIFGHGLTFWTGWASLVSFLLMFITCFPVYCFMEKKCLAKERSRKKKTISRKHPVFSIEMWLHKYHIYFVVLTLIIVVIHTILAAFGSFFRIWI
jgi:hypothetical protein